MHLGNLIAKLADERSTAETMAALGDIVLFAGVVEAAESYRESAGEYVAATVSRFAELAGDEAWLQLMSTIEAAADPGTAALQLIVRWGLAEDRRHRDDDPFRAAAGMPRNP